MPDLIKVGMADYKVGAAPSTLISYGLGSCIGLSLYDPKAKVGGLLHYMLPDSKRARSSDTPAKFIDTGFPLMLADVLKLGGARSRLVAKIAGGAQMFACSNTTSVMRVGERNTQAAKELLAQHGIRFIAEDTGLNYGRTVSIDLNDGTYMVKTVSKGDKTI